MKDQDSNHAGLPQDTSAASTAKKRTRRAHPKVRTGCITCKIRRKKCDETKPECWRCTSTGRKCDGYSKVASDHVVTGDTFGLVDTDTSEERMSEEDRICQVQYVHSCSSGLSDSSFAGSSPIDASTPSAYGYHNKSQQRILEPRAQFVELVRAPSMFSSTYPITELQGHCFSYFRYRTGPQLGSYFESTLWHHYSTTIGLSHPVVFACAAALGAVHRRFNLGISTEAFQWCAHSDRLIKNARRLLMAFERDIRDQNLLLGSSSSSPEPVFELGSSGSGIDDNDVMMTSHMLLFLFEAFQTDFSAAILNLKLGIRYLLLRPMKLIYSKTSYPTYQHNPDVLVKHFERIKLRARGYFGSMERILVQKGNHFDQCGDLLPIPNKFENLEHARDSIFTEVHWILRTPAYVWKTKNSRDNAHNVHVNRFLRWSAAYTETIRCMNRTEAEKRVGLLLKATRSLAYHLLYLATHMHGYLPEETVPVYPELTGMGVEDYSIETNDCICEDGSSAKRHRVAGEAIQNEAVQSSASVLAAPSLWNAIAQREDLLSNLHVLRMWADISLDPNSPFQYIEHSVSFDSAIGRTIDPLPSPKSSGKVRFKVKYSLGWPESLGDTSNHFGQHGIYGFSEQLSSIEEHAVFEAVQSRVPPNAILKWADLTIFAEERRILLQYGISGSEMSNRITKWKQEWWMF